MILRHRQKNFNSIINTHVCPTSAWIIVTRLHRTTKHIEAIIFWSVIDSFILSYNRHVHIIQIRIINSGNMYIIWNSFRLFTQESPWIWWLSNQKSRIILAKLDKYIETISNYFPDLLIRPFSCYVGLAVSYDHINRDSLFSSVRNHLPSFESIERWSDREIVSILGKVQALNHFKPY